MKITFATKQFLGLFLLVLIPAFFSSLSAKDRETYRWPTNASRVLNSTFGEYRPGHFHSGIDIKTWEKEGFRVYAVRNGYVTRIRVSPFGYGKALYLKLDTGEFAVYGHLQRFAPKIERYVKKIQKQRQQYSLDLSLKPTRFPVHRGQVVAFTGRTGIGAPHLHFEIRDAKNRPINPLLKLFPLDDTIFPTITGFAVIPLDRFSQVEGEALPQIFDVVRVRRGHFRLKKPVQVWGSLGLAVSAFDRTASIPNKCSVYRLSLEIDGRRLFSTRYDRLSFGQTREIVLDRNYRLISWFGRYFNNLFLLPGNSLSFYTPNQTGAGMLETFPGIISDFQKEFSPGSTHLNNEGLRNFWHISRLLPGRHSVKIDVSDFSGNRSVLRATLTAAEKKPTLVDIHQSDHTLFVTPLVSDSVRASISEDSGKTWHSFSWVGKNQKGAYLFNLPYAAQSEAVWLQLQTLDSLGICHFPEFYHPFPSSLKDPPLPQIRLVRKRFLDQFVVYTVAAPGPVARPLFLRYKAGKRTGRSRLLPISTTRFEATVPLDSVAEKKTLVFVDVGRENSRQPLDTLRVFKVNLSETRYIRLLPDGTDIKFRQNTAFQPLFFRYSKEPLSAVSAPLPGDSITYLLHLAPQDVPLNRGVILNFHIPESQTELRKLAVYSPGKRHWSFQSNYLDPALRAIKVPLRSFGRFTILQDTIPPEITRVLPRPGRSVRTREPVIRAYFRDNLSGIGSEKSVHIFLDGTFQISEYDPEMKRVTFEPDWPLHSGKHIAEVRVTDRCGNTSRKLWYFFVRKVKK